MSFQNFKFPTSTNPNAPKKFKIVKEYKAELSPLVFKTFALGTIFGGKRLNKDKQPIKVTKVQIACFAAPCPEMWNEEDTSFLEITSGKSLINIPIEYLQEVVEPKSASTQNNSTLLEPDSNSNQNTNNLNNSKPKEPLFYVLVTIGVLTLGYFAYNKLKK